MITVSMPVGSAHGWGVCGKYISRELAALADVRLLSDPFTLESLGDELEYASLNALRFRQQDAAGARQEGPTLVLPGPLLTCIGDKQLTPWKPNLRGTPTVGYTFFEENLLQKSWIDNGLRNFDVIAAGSSWNEEVLRSCGLTKVHTVIQGVDPRVFFPWPTENHGAREFLRDQFVIFSGGKFELRKGQDIVIRAVKVLQDRHPDVVLVNSWYNGWQHSFDTMKASPYLRWPNVSGTFIDVMNRLLAENGLDLSRVITLGPRPNALMPKIYRNSDVGLFPNRCEGGTNLVLMEYMACGKPVVAVNSTGHRDVIRDTHALLINIKGENTYNGPTGPVAKWPEPDLDDTINKLEFAYQNRPQLAALGSRAAAEMRQLTWTRSAEDFLKILAP